jgi:hypothetical protein
MPAKLVGVLQEQKFLPAADVGLDPLCPLAMSIRWTSPASTRRAKVRYRVAGATSRPRRRKWASRSSAVKCPRMERISSRMARLERVIFRRWLAR